MRENIVYVSLRLNMDVPKHVEINKKLQKLNPNVYKSKNQFVIDALEFYIQNFGNEQYMLENEPSPFITKVELKDVSQDTSDLNGNLSEYAEKNGIEESLFKSILRKLDFSREQFEKNIEDFSEGQKKKVIIAESLCEQAHVYIWDEPLNFIDVISRIQIEKLLVEYEPTILFVEHDSAFCDNVATKIINL